MALLLTRDTCPEELSCAMCGRESSAIPSSHRMRGGLWAGFQLSHLSTGCHQGVMLSKALLSHQPASCAAAGRGAPGALSQPECARTPLDAKPSKLLNRFASLEPQMLTGGVVFLPLSQCKPSVDTWRPKMLGILPFVTCREIRLVGSVQGCCSAEGRAVRRLSRLLWHRH